MAYFPLFFDFSNKPVSIIGGGHTALEKAKRLLKTGAALTIIAPECADELEQMAAQKKIQLINRGWMVSDLDGCQFVIAATDDYFENERIAKACRYKGILCNVVDNAALSDCIFGAVIEQGDLVIGVSTSGASPSAAVYIKNQIRSIITEEFSSILEWLAALRPVIIERYKVQPIRAALFSQLFKDSLANHGPLDADHLEALLLLYDQKQKEEEQK